MPPTPPPPISAPGAGTCVLTITITNTAGISNTQFPTGTITGTIPISPVLPITQTFIYTRDMNLVANASFESANGGGPSDWDQVMDGSFRAFDWTNWWLNGQARTGSRYMVSSFPFDLYQDVSLYGPHTKYRVGAYSRCGEAGCADHWNIWLDLAFGLYAPNPEMVATAGVNATDYISFSGATRSPRAGVMQVFIRPLGNGSYLDDVFVYPVEDDGLTAICLPEYYPPPGPDDGLPPGYILPPELGGVAPPGSGTQPIGGIPGPIAGAGAICYYCTAPRDVGASAVSYWIAWLGCVVRNMFACSLRVWLMYVMNTVYGVFQIGYAFLSWVPAQAQATINWTGLQMQQSLNWIASDVVPALGVNVHVESGTNVWDAIVALIEMINGILGGLLSLLASLVSVIGSLISSLADQLLGFAKLLVDLALALPRALAAEPYEFNLDGASDPRLGLESLDDDSGGRPGTSPNRILWIVLYFAGLVDSMVAGGGAAAVLWLAVSAIGFGVVVWTLNHWRDLLSF